MPEFIRIENAGQDILSSNYWQTEAARAGKIYASANAGAVRLLLPKQYEPVLGEWVTTEYVIISRGKWADEGWIDAVELLFEDGSDDPYCLHLSATSFDILPGEPDPGQEWIVSAWVQGGEKPMKMFERPAKWRRVKRIPWLKPWGED